MQKLPVETHLAFENSVSIACFCRRRTAIERVSHARMMRIRHMHADLMGASREQMAFEKRIAVIETPGLEALEHRERGDRLWR